MVGLLPSWDVEARVTPSALFDELTRLGWEDVTDESYPNDPVESWNARNKVSWQTEYYFGVGQAQFWSNDYAFNELWRVIERQFDHTNTKLQGYIDLLHDLRNGPQPSDPQGDGKVTDETNGEVEDEKKNVPKNTDDGTLDGNPKNE